MENKELAILGHPTRGNEVLKILEMLGGKNLKSTGSDETCIYTIDSTSSFIEPIPFYDFSSKYYDNLHTEYYIFTLEKFLEKYPYKVGDKVKTIYGKIGNVSKCKWDADNNCMIYKLDTSVYNNSFYFAHELIPHKEEIKAEDRLEIHTDPAIDNDSKTNITIDGEKLIAPNGYTVKTMRNLKDVINEMLEVIPNNEIELISKLKNIRKEQIYRAPESTVGWELVSEELELIKLDFNSEYWKFKIFSIFSTMSMEDIEKELK